MIRQRCITKTVGFAANNFKVNFFTQIAVLKIKLLLTHAFLQSDYRAHLNKKGKLEELNFILSGGGMGGLPTYAPDFYQDEPWVEFIEVDAEDPDTGEKEDNQGSDTQRLLGVSQPVSHHMHIGCSNTIRYCTDLI